MNEKELKQLIAWLEKQAQICEHEAEKFEIGESMNWYFTGKRDGLRMALFKLDPSQEDK